MDVRVKIGYSLAPGWTDQWRSIERHLARLREQYQGIGIQGNVDLWRRQFMRYTSLSIIFPTGCTKTAPYR